MQPFGLFSFLQTLLGENNPPSNPSEVDAPATEKASNESLPTPEEITPTTDNQQALLQFLQAHDNRIARTKKR